MRRDFLLLGLLAALCCGLAIGRWRVPENPDTAPRLESAQREIEGRFQGWTKRVEGAADGIVRLWQETGTLVSTLFERAQTLVDDMEVDGVLVLDENDRAVLWAGRTFDVSSREDFLLVRQGTVGDVRVLDRPAHRVLCSARRAGDGIAIAFLSFDERFPVQRDLAEEIRLEHGLAAVRFQFGGRNDPSPVDVPDGEPGRSFVLPGSGGGIGLCKVDLFAPAGPALATEQATLRDRLARATWVAFAALLAWALWIFAGKRLPPNRLLRVGLGVMLLIGVRYTLAAARLPALPAFSSAAPVDLLFAGPGNLFLTAATLLFCMRMIEKAAQHKRPRVLATLLALSAIGLGVFAPRVFLAGLGQAIDIRHDVTIFDPLSLFPDFAATIVLASLCMLMAAFFYGARALTRFAGDVHPVLAPLPVLAIALGALPWQGPTLAIGVVLAHFAMGRKRSLPERVLALSFFAALTTFPILFSAREDARAEELARRVRTLVKSDRRDLLVRAANRVTHRTHGVDLMVANAIADTHADKKRLAFTLWSAADWDLSEACAVQVWDAEGVLLSTFDFDSPPQDLLPMGVPTPDELGLRTLEGPPASDGLRYFAYDIPLRLPLEETTVGFARFSVPDRWQALLRGLRPSIFIEPLDKVLGANAPPALLAHLSKKGTAKRTSDRTTTSLERVDKDALDDAKKHGFAITRTTYRGQDARLVLAEMEDGFAAVLFTGSLLRRGSLAFAKVLLVGTAAGMLALLCLFLIGQVRFTFLFRHRVALVLILLSVPPVVLLAVYNRTIARQRHEKQIDDQLQSRLDLAQTLLRKPGARADREWCGAFASDHRADLNIYRGAELIATSRPGVWDTGLLTRRMDAAAYVSLAVERRGDYTGSEFFGGPGGLRAAYRTVEGPWGPEPLTLAAPALENRRELERVAAADNAILLGAYLLTAVLMLFAALFLARSLTSPVQELHDATRRVAAGDLDASLPEGRGDEFGELVSAFNRMTRELKDAQDLRVRAEKEAAWREMAKQVAHEIKNPLTPMKLTIQNLLAAHAQDDETFREQFEAGTKNILEQIEALRRIAGEFSAYARFPVRDPEPLDLEKLTADVAGFFAGAGAQIETTCITPPPYVRADRDELRRALINLVTNSRQAEASLVTLAVTRQNGNAVITVEDDGSGIPADAQKHIFEPSFTTKSAGTGLGLPIVKRLVDDLGGEIEITSEAGKGTRVVIVLLEAPSSKR
ncbi:MAG: ATP-binding protein [Planctomycetota bacterium]